MEQAELSGAFAYMDAVAALLDDIRRTQAGAIDAAATAVTRAIEAGGVVYLFGTGHSHMLAEEGHYRAGGLVPVVPIFDEALMLHKGAVESTKRERETGVSAPLLARYNPTPDDVLIVFSNSGVNAVPVEMAQAGKTAGMAVIAFVARQYEAQTEAKVGQKLSEVADIVIDNRGVRGDAVVPLGDEGIRVAPTSTVAGAFILNAIVAEVATRLHRPDQPAPVYISANVPGASEHNQRLMERYGGRNPHL